MTDAEVLLDVRGADRAELTVAATTLLKCVPGIGVVHADQEQQTVLTERFADRVTFPDLRTAPVPREVPLLVASARTAYARGAVRRLLADLATPGRCLSAVLVPGEPVGSRVAGWAPSWLRDYAGTLEELVNADLAFDRAHLPASSPLARAWLRGDAVGIVRAGSVDGDPDRWGRRVGLLLERDAAVARVRAPLGAVRRRAARWRQRHAQPEWVELH